MLGRSNIWQRLSEMPNLLQICHDSWKLPTRQAFSTSGHVSKCGRLKNLLPSSVSLRNLRNLRVSECHGLSCLVPSSTAKSLVQLREMIIAGCKRLTEIVTDEGGDEAGDEISFSQLKYFELEYLPSLKGFTMSNHTIRFPFLGRVTVTECPELKRFSNGVVRTPKLKEVQLAEKNKSMASGATSLLTVNGTEILIPT